MDAHIKGGILIIISMFLFAVQGVLVRYVSLDTVTLYSYFQAIFLIVLVLILLVTRNKESFKLHHPIKPVIASSILIVISVLSYFQAFRLTTLANAALTHYTAPIFAFIVAIIFLKEKFDWNSFAAIILSMLGIYLIFSSQQSSLEYNLGILYGLVSGITYGILINVNKTLVKRDNIMILMLYQTIPIALFFSPFLFMTLPSPRDLLLISLITIISGVTAAFIYLKGLRDVKAKHAGIIAYVEVLFIVIFGFIFFKEIPTIMTWFGGSLIVASGIWIIVEEAKKTSSS